MNLKETLQHYIGKPRGPGIDVTVPQVLLMAALDDISRKEAFLAQAVDALEWSATRLEELTEENARLMRLLG